MPTAKYFESGWLKYIPLTLLAGLIAVVVPWSVRSSVVLHAPVFVSSSLGSTLRAGSNAELWNDHARRGGTLDAPAVTTPAPPGPPSAPRARAEADADRRAFAEALQFLGSRPVPEIRELLRVPSKSAGAIEGGSVGLFDPEGMSENQRRLVAQRREAER